MHKGVEQVAKLEWCLIKTTKHNKVNASLPLGDRLKTVIDNSAIHILLNHLGLCLHALCDHPSVQIARMVDLICCKSSVKFIVYKNIEIYLNITF